jgi:hypothetical protein
MNTITKMSGRFADITLTGTTTEIATTVAANERAGRLVFVTPARPVPGTQLVSTVIRLRPEATASPATHTAVPTRPRRALTATAHRHPTVKRRPVLLWVGTPAIVIAAAGVGGFTVGYHGIGITVLRIGLAIVALVLIAAALFEIGTNGTGHHCPGCPDH